MPFGMLELVSTFVIVHGAWGGGWEWSGVARRLRARGHEVFTPTLTGMGERAHLCPTEPIGLAAHVADLVSLVEFEDLRDVVLCGASYGGMPVTGAAERLVDRLRLLIYVDALVPLDGQSALDLLPASFGDMVVAGLAEHGPGWRAPQPADLFDALMPPGSLPDHVRDAYQARVRDHPAASFVEPVRLTGVIDSLPRAFVRCTTGEFSEAVGGDPIQACAEGALAEGWPYRELTAPHDPQVYNPAGTTALLEELAETL